MRTSDIETEQIRTFYEIETTKFIIGYALDTTSVLHGLVIFNVIDAKRPLKLRSQAGKFETLVWHQQEAYS